jgi:hypothetical protein
MKDYSPFRLRILFLRRCLAAYLSLALLGLGAGIGRADDKKLFFNTPPSHELRLACTPVPKSDNPVVQQLLEQFMPASKGPDNSVPPAVAEQPSYKDFSLVAAPEQNSFSLAKPIEKNPIPNHNYLPQKLLIGLHDISILSQTPVPAARNLESLVNIYQTVPMALMGQEAKQEKHSKWWIWPLAIIGAAAVAYGAYKLFFDKHSTTTTTTTTIPPTQVTLNFDFYRYPTGFLKTITKQAMSNSSVNIAISEAEATDVDSSYCFLYNGNTFMQMASSGSVTLTAPATAKNYNIVLMPTLDQNQSPGVSYNWMTSAKLYTSTRNYVVYRKDRDNQTGPEGSWTSVWSQLRSAINLNWIKLGSITEKPLPNDGTGTFSYGYAICIDPYRNVRVDGLHMGEYIIIDAERLRSESARRAIGLAEGFENISVVDNIGGNPSSMTIQFQGVLNNNGKALFAFAFLKDSTAGIEFNPTSSSAVPLGQLASEMSMRGVTAARARNGGGRKASISDVMSVMPMLMPMNIEGKLGRLAFGADPISQKLYARLGTQSSGFTGEIVNAGSLTDWIGRANAFVNYRGIAGSFDLAKGAGNEMARATVSADVLDELAVGLSNLYQNGKNSYQLHIGAFGDSKEGHKLVVGYGRTNAKGLTQQNIDAKANLGPIIVDANARFNERDKDISLGVAARLGMMLFYGAYNNHAIDNISRSYGSASLAVPTGPINFSLTGFYGSGHNKGITLSGNVRF